MHISSISNLPGAIPADALLQQPLPAGQNLPGAAQPAQSDYAGVFGVPRASLTASATAVLSQSVDEDVIRLDMSRQTAVYQSYMNAQGYYGYQSTLGAPLVG